MIEVVGDIVPLELAVIIIGMHLLRYWLVQVFVEVAKEIPTLLRSQVKHKDEPACVDNHQCHHEPIQALHGWAESILWVWLEVTES